MCPFLLVLSTFPLLHVAVTLLDVCTLETVIAHCYNSYKCYNKHLLLYSAYF